MKSVPGSSKLMVTLDKINSLSGIIKTTRKNLEYEDEMRKLNTDTLHKIYQNQN